MTVNSPPTQKKKKKKKLRHPLNFQNGRYMLPVFMQNNLLRSFFLMKEENEGKKKGKGILLIRVRKFEVLSAFKNENLG